MNLTRYEQETIINFNEEEATASVYTHNNALRHRLEKLDQARPEECEPGKISHGGQAVEYIVPKSWIRINPTRQLTDEQRTAMAETARKRFGNSKPKGIALELADDGTGKGKDTSLIENP